MRTEFDAIIVGAGPAGAAAAILLARAGWSVALVEKQRFPRRKVCGECIAASNLPLLSSLGIGAVFEAAAGPELRHVALMRGMRTVVAQLPPNADKTNLWGRALARETLDTLLVEQARLVGAHVLQPWSVKRIHGSVGAWQCDVRAVDSTDALTLHAPVLIDAHGSWEALPADNAPRRVAHRGSDLLAFKANFHTAQLTHGLLPVLLFDGGYGGMVTAGGDLTTVAGCIRRDRLEALRTAWPGLSAGDTFEAMLRRECAGVRHALRSARREGPWLAAGPLNPGIRVRADDRIFRIGNAAGEAHPIIGEGMSMALQSAWLLCEHLLLPAPNPATRCAAWQGPVARDYATEWRRLFQTRIRLASVFAHAAMRPALAAPLLTMARYWPGLLTVGAIQCGKTRSIVARNLLGNSSEPGSLQRHQLAIDTNRKDIP
jgi:flavin-dependent dehydrogenase